MCNLKQEIKPNKQLLPLQNLKELLTGYKNAQRETKKEAVLKRLQDWITTQAKDMDEHEKHLEFVKSLN